MELIGFDEASEFTSGAHDYLLNREPVQNYPACRLTYQGNVLCCSRYRTFERNYQTAFEALCLLLGFELTQEQFKESGGKVERFRTIGYARNR